MRMGSSSHRSVRLTNSLRPPGAFGKKNGSKRTK